MLTRVVGEDGPAPVLLINDALRQPVAVGVLRPTIILPGRFLEEEPANRLAAALAHEWAHIRNRDLWLIAASRLLLPVLYAHPAYWWLRRRIRDDQEALADASAAAVGGRLNYAEVLLSWSLRTPGHPPFATDGGLALFERPSQIKRRILMLLDGSFRVETTLLDRGRSVKGKVVGPDGEPLAGARIEGLQESRIWSDEPLPSAEFLVEGIGRGASRDLLVYHEAKNLAGAHVIRADEGGPISVKLEPCGAVTGRLVASGGLPLSGVEMTCDVPFHDVNHEAGSLPAPVKTGEDGRFRVEGLVPGRKYTFHIWKGNRVEVVAKDIVAARGDTRDLGDVTPRTSE